MKTAPVILAALLLLAQTGGPAAQTPTDASAEPPIERMEWTGKIAAGGVVRVENLHGDVRARFGGYEGQVEVRAVLQQLEPREPLLEVRSAAAGADIAVTVGHRAAGVPEVKATSAPNAAAPPADRADLVLLVPQGAKLVVRTAAGMVEVSGLQSDVEIETVKGEVVVKRTNGRIRVRNERGETLIILEKIESRELQRFESTTGNVTVHFPPDDGFLVEASTSGHITTDYSIEIEPLRGQEPNKRARARTGKGDKPLEIRSKRGNIRVLRLP